MAGRFAYNRPRVVRTSKTLASAEVTGFSDLNRQLTENLPKITQRTVIKRAGEHAIEPMKDRAMELAPERTGATRISIRLISKFLKARGQFGAAVRVTLGAGSREVFWPRFAERGTVKEPARPFMRPAFDEKVGETIARLKESLAIEVSKAIARRVRRLARRR